MKVLFAFSEVSPFASTGGLAEIAGSLPQALINRPEAGGSVEVARIMPLYRQTAEGGYDLKETGLRLEVPVGLRMLTGEVYVAEAPGPKTYFIRRDEFFDRTHLYGLPDRDYDDNFERFVFFQKAVVSLLDQLGQPYDVVHCSDWQTGLIPLFLRYGVQGMGRMARERTVFTIHNLAYQGNFPGTLYTFTNLPFACFSTPVLEFYGHINFMKAGITTADVVTTVSRTYAKEIRTAEYGFGLHGVLAELPPDRLVGILNGVDYGIWDPSVDVYIAQRYDASDLAGKKVCRNDLLQQMGLKVSEKAPVLGMISRLVDQKGMDILAEAMPSLMAEGVSFVLLGQGQARYEVLAQEWAKRWPDRFGVRLRYDKELAHKIMAGADMLLMPSRFEPCGLNQIFGLRYGTIPVVHATGGLEDTVDDVGAAAREGTGFKFDDFSADALLKSVQRAYKLFSNPAAWLELARRAMAKDFSWQQSAAEYIRLYQALLRP